MVDDTLMNTFDIEYFLQREGIKYRKTYGSSGEQLNVRECPVCHQTKWKVYLNADTGLGNCFSGSCGATFNKFSFTKAYLETNDNRQVYETIRNVCKELGWAPKVEKPKLRVSVSTLDDLILPEHIDLPTPDGSNLEYLLKRGVDNYYTELFELKFTTNGIWKYQTNDGIKQQVFQNRILIPIRDIDGKLVSFQGRDVTGTAISKYQFPSQVAATGKLLYNSFREIGKKIVILNEGVFDVIATQIALDRGGLSSEVGVIASFGKHLSIDKNGFDDQLSRLLLLKKQGLEVIVVMWDGERKAYSAAVEVASKLSGYGFKMKIAELPVGKDPNEVHYSEVVMAYKNAKDFNEFTMKVNNPYE